MGLASVILLVADIPFQITLSLLLFQNHGHSRLVTRVTPKWESAQSSPFSAFHRSRYNFGLLGPSLSSYWPCVALTFFVTKGVS